MLRLTQSIAILLVNISEASNPRLIALSTSLKLSRLSLLQLFILPLMHKAQSKRQPTNKQTNNRIRRTTRDILRPRTRRVHIATIDTRGICYHIGDGDAGGALDERSGEGVSDP